MERELGPTYVKSVALWSPVQILNFRFVPVYLQPALVNTAAAFWNVHISGVLHSDAPPPAAPVLGSVPSAAR